MDDLNDNIPNFKSTTTKHETKNIRRHNQERKIEGHSADNVPLYFMQNYAVYWPEGGAASQYSVLIGQKMQLTGQKLHNEHA